MSTSAGDTQAESLSIIRTDFIVIGSGVAGLWTALHLAGQGRVALLTKGALREGNTEYAQGGIAVALSPKDSPEFHLQDTLAAGAELVDVPAAEVLTYEAPRAIAQLIDCGAHFDRDDGHLLLGREAAHGQRRIIHANGDATGAEVERALCDQVRAHDSIDLYEEVMALRLLMLDGVCAGVDARDLAGEADLRFLARATCLATGGLGCLYRRTTNPPVATGDGQKRGFDPLESPIPVSPVAHFAMGGVDVDLSGTTSVERLYACGECACTGVHGANRLASNSLLEGLVFGKRCAKAMAQTAPLPAQIASAMAQAPSVPVPVAGEVYGEIREMMWDDVGIIRSEHSLNNALKNLVRLSQEISDCECPGRWEFERANMALVADIIVRAAISRKESRGAHYRTDFPEPRQSRLYHNLLYQDSQGNVRTSTKPVDLSRKRKPLEE